LRDSDRSSCAEPPPRRDAQDSTCVPERLSPLYVAGELLHGEGFLDVRYVKRQYTDRHQRDETRR
jgi:hypothetical protein